MTSKSKVLERRRSTKFAYLPVPSAPIPSLTKSKKDDHGEDALSVKFKHMHDLRGLCWRMFQDLDNGGAVESRKFHNLIHAHVTVSANMTKWMEANLPADDLLHWDCATRPNNKDITWGILQHMVTKGYIARVVKSDDLESEDIGKFKASDKTTKHDMERRRQWKSTTHTLFKFFGAHIAPFQLHIKVKSAQLCPDEEQRKKISKNVSTFVRITLDDHLIAESMVRDNTLDPEWENLEFVVGVDDPSKVQATLTLTLLDHHHLIGLHSPEVGHTLVSTAELPLESPDHVHELPLVINQSYSGIKKGGQSTLTTALWVENGHKRSSSDRSSEFAAAHVGGASGGGDPVTETEDQGSHAAVDVCSSSSDEEASAGSQWLLSARFYEAEGVTYGEPEVRVCKYAFTGKIYLNTTHDHTDVRNKDLKKQGVVWRGGNGCLVKLNPTSVNKDIDDVQVIICERLSTDAVGMDRRIAGFHLPVKEVPQVYISEYDNESEPEPKWYDLYKVESGHRRHNGRVLMSVWMMPEGAIRDTPFRRRLKNVRLRLGVGLGLVVVLQLLGVLHYFVFYPFWAILLILAALPFLLFLPGLLGMFMTFILTKVALKGFPLGFGSVGLLPWICPVTHALNLRINVTDFTFANPPGFPDKHFLRVGKVNLHLRFPLNLVRTVWMRFKQVKWSPFPAECAAKTQFYPEKGETICNAPGAMFGVIGIESLDVDDVTINFQMCNGSFNINAFSALLADGKTFGSIPEFDAPPPAMLAPLYRFAGRFQTPPVYPNCVVVKVECARNLVFKSQRPKPRVVVNIRSFSYETDKVEINPVFADWGQEFRVPCEDPSAVLCVSVFDETALVGRWIMTMKFFRIKKDYNFHDEIDLTGASGYEISGWFTLMDKDMLRRGEVGSLKLRMSWVYDPQFDFERSECIVTKPKQLKALEQLQENSAETTLKMGNLHHVTNMLDTFPLLLDVKRVTIRDVRFFLEDLFRGYSGAGESGVKQKAITVDKIEVCKALKLRPNQEGLTIWEFLIKYWAVGLAPVVAAKGRVLAQGGAQILGALASSMGGGGKAAAAAAAASNSHSARHPMMHLASQHLTSDWLNYHVPGLLGSADGEHADGSSGGSEEAKGAEEELGEKAGRMHSFRTLPRTKH